MHPYPNQIPAPIIQKRRPVFKWCFIVVQVLFVIWIIAGSINGQNAGSSNCGTLDAQTCQDATDVGTAIGVGIIIFFWFMVDMVMLVGRLVVQHGRKNNKEGL